MYMCYVDGGVYATHYGRSLQKQTPIILPRQIHLKTTEEIVPLKWGSLGLVRHHAWSKALAVRVARQVVAACGNLQV